jgi:hypothetical protein
LAYQLEEIKGEAIVAQLYSAVVRREVIRMKFATPLYIPNMNISKVDFSYCHRIRQEHERICEKERGAGGRGEERGRQERVDAKQFRACIQISNFYPWLLADLSASLLIPIHSCVKRIYLSFKEIQSRAWRLLTFKALFLIRTLSHN